MTPEERVKQDCRNYVVRVLQERIAELLESHPDLWAFPDSRWAEWRAVVDELMSLSGKIRKGEV
jgi:hypothetical protein